VPRLRDAAARKLADVLNNAKEGDVVLGDPALVSQVRELTVCHGCQGRGWIRIEHKAEPHPPRFRPNDGGGSILVVPATRPACDFKEGDWLVWSPRCEPHSPPLATIGDKAEFLKRYEPQNDAARKLVKQLCADLTAALVVRDPTAKTARTT